jgi:DNA invertase Pin-like site-specific DNA recombinase
MVAAWSVDRLGRSLQDLIEVLSDLHAKGVDLYLHQQGLDTSTPSGRAMHQMMGVFAGFERAIIRERILSGLARAKAEGIAHSAWATFDREQRREVRSHQGGARRQEGRARHRPRSKDWRGHSAWVKAELAAAWPQ